MASLPLCLSGSARAELPFQHVLLQHLLSARLLCCRCQNTPLQCCPYQGSLLQCSASWLTLSKPPSLQGCLYPGSLFYKTPERDSYQSRLSNHPDTRTVKLRPLHGQPSLTHYSDGQATLSSRAVEPCPPWAVEPRHLRQTGPRPLLGRPSLIRHFTGTRATDSRATPSTADWTMPTPRAVEACPFHGQLRLAHSTGTRATPSTADEPCPLYRQANTLLHKRRAVLFMGSRAEPTPRAVVQPCPLLRQRPDHALSLGCQACCDSTSGEASGHAIAPSPRQSSHGLTPSPASKLLCSRCQTNTHTPTLLDTYTSLSNTYVYSPGRNAPLLTNIHTLYQTHAHILSTITFLYLSPGHIHTHSRKHAHIHTHSLKQTHTYSRSLRFNTSLQAFSARATDAGGA